MAKHLASGKVREIWELDAETLAIVATDRISAYDVVFAEPVLDRGRILTMMSAWWMNLLRDVVPTHLVEVADKTSHLPAEIGDPDWLVGRASIVRRAEMLPIECIVRGYLYGSAWREYEKTGSATGLDLPPGMKIAEKLPAPTFTPSTKAVSGHDENIDMETARRLVGDAADEAARVSVELYQRAAQYALARGIVIADTKFEFGLVDGELVWCDEAFTPDSSRFWYAKDWEPGIDPPAYDKQFLRAYLDTLDWDKQPPPPPLPDEVLAATRARYIEAYEVLTRENFPW